MRGLVVPGDALASMAPEATAGSDSWQYSRNDRLLNPRAAVRPRSLQWVEIWQREQLRISNGRPFDHTSIETRTYQLSPRR